MSTVISEETKSIMLAGVGGQGTILAAKILSEGLHRMGFDVKMSEIHGMSQRGGSVTSHVRYGTQVCSPVIALGKADVIVGFEQLEALRHLPYLKHEGMMIVNDVEIYPLPVLIGSAQYPAGITDELTRQVKHCTVIPAHRKAAELGSSRVENILLLGAVVAAMGLENFSWDDIMAELIKRDFVAVNQQAFSIGRSYMQGRGK